MRGPGEGIQAEEHPHHGNLACGGWLWDQEAEAEIAGITSRGPHPRCAVGSALNVGNHGEVPEEWAWGKLSLNCPDGDDRGLNKDGSRGDGEQWVTSLLWRGCIQALAVVGRPRNGSWMRPRWRGRC